MAESPQVADADLVSIAVLVDGQAIPDTYEIARIEVVQAVNRIPVAKLTVLDGDAAEETFAVSEAAHFVPGKQIEIKAGYHGHNATVFKGVIVRQGIRVQRNRNSYLTVSCNDAAVSMTVSRSSTQFVDMRDSEAIAEVVKAHGLKAEVERTSQQHEQLVKHYASDWDYVVTRAEANGQIVIVNDATVKVAAPRFDPPALVVRYGESLTDIDAEIDARFQAGAVSARAWDPATQALVTGKSAEPSTNQQGNVTGKTLSKVVDAGDFELQAGATLSQDELDGWANARLLKARLARCRGTVSFPGSALAKPGEQLQLAGLGARFNGNAFIATVKQVVEAGNWTTTVEFGLSAHWFAEQRSDIDAPAADALRPAIHGVHIATVRQIHDDPQGERRINVVLPMVAGGDDGLWVRLASPYASADAGIYFMPEIGDEVVLAFVHDDPVSAVVLGSLHSSARAAPYVPDDQNTMKAIVTNSQMKISFDDVKKVLCIETPGGHRITLSDEDSSVTTEDSNGNTLVMDASGIRMKSPGDISIKADGKFDLNATGGISLSTPQDFSLQAMNASLQANASLTAKGSASAELSAAGNVTVKGAIVMIN